MLLIYFTTWFSNTISISKRWFDCTKETLQWLPPPRPIKYIQLFFFTFFFSFSSKNTKQNQTVHMCCGEFYPPKSNIKLDILHFRASWLSSVKSKTNKQNGLQPNIGGVHPQMFHLKWIRSFPAQSRDIAHNQVWKCRNCD